MKTLLVAMISALAPVASGAETPSYSDETPAASPDSYSVGARDVLEVLVYGEAELSQEQLRVDENGDVLLPLLQRVHVEGMTAQQIAAELERQYKDGGFLVHPHVTVSVKEYLSQQVEVIGGVPKVGLYYLSVPTSLSTLLAQAGWIDAATANGQATVRHADGTSEVIDLVAMTQVGGPNPELRAGDQVQVGEGQVVFVGGEVGKEGKYPYQKGLTVGQALSLAGGASPVARLAGAYILRADQKIPVNLKKIRRGRETDVTLEPGDRLYVPESPI